MKSFIGVKLVKAEPMYEKEAIRRGFARERENPDVYREGYYILYPDGYESWSPKEVFDNHYRELNHLPFSLALEFLKQGKRISREAWKDGDAFLWTKHATVVQAAWCHDNRLKSIVEANGGQMDSYATICMKTSDNKILTGWNASQVDLFAEDWFVLD